MNKMDHSKFEYIDDMWHLPKEYVFDILDMIVNSFIVTLHHKRIGYDKILDEFSYSYAEVGAVYFGAKYDECYPSEHKKIVVSLGAEHTILSDKFGYEMVGCLLDIDEFIELCLEVASSNESIDNSILEKELELVRETYNRLMKE